MSTVRSNERSQRVSGEPGGSIHRERGRPGATLDLRHREYLEQHPGGYQCATFCERYHVWLERRGLTMRQRYVAGDKRFVDYSGKRPSIVDPHSRPTSAGVRPASGYHPVILIAG